MNCWCCSFTAAVIAGSCYVGEDAYSEWSVAYNTFRVEDNGLASDEDVTSDEDEEQDVLSFLI